MNVQVRRVGAYALVTAQGKILLSLTNRGPIKGKWNLIGGGLEHGEAPEAGLLRELQEEAGLEITKVPPLLTVLNKRYDYFRPDTQEAQDLQLIGIIYDLRLPRELPCKIGPDGDSSEGCRWFEIASLDHSQVAPFVSEALKIARL